MTKGKDKTKEQPIKELAEMRQRIAELETSETKRRQMGEALATQRDLSMTLSATSRLDEALKLCLETAISMAQMDSGSIHLVDSTSGSIDFACHQGFSPQFAETVSHYEPNSAQARLIMAGRAIYSRHQDLGLPLDEARRSEGVRALAIVPVLYKGRVIACLKIASHTLDDVPLTARASLETIATQIGSTIAHIEAEEELRESERRFRDVTENALEWIWEVDASGKYTYASPACEKILGYKPEELLEKHFYNLFIPEEQEQLKKTAFEAFANKQPFHEFINQNIHKSGRLVWLSTSGAPVLDEKGNLLGYRGADLDITERKRAEETLREERDKAQEYLDVTSTTLSAIPHAVIGLHERHITFANSAVEDVFGWKPEELIGKNTRVLYRSDKEYKEIGRHFYPVLDSQKTHFEEFPCRCKDGRDIVCLVGASRMGENLREKRIVATYTDITEHKRAEEALRESEEKYHTLFEDSRDAVFITTRDGELTSANQAYLDLSGYTREEATGLDVRKTYANPDDRLRYQQEMERKGTVKDFELRLRKKDGTELDCLLTATIRQPQDGVTLGYQGVIRDITEHKQMEETLRESEEKYRGLVGNVDIGICRVSPGDKGDFIEVNPAMSRIFGYSREELLRMNVSETYQDPAERKKFADKIHAQGLVKNEELKLRRKDGTPIVVSNTSTAVRDEKGNIIYIDAILEDITERKRAEEALVDEATRRRILVEQSRDGIVILDQNGKVYEANQQFAKMLGYSPEETAQLHVWDWDTQWTHEQLLEMLGSVDAAGDHFETYHRRKDGTIYDVEISTNGAVYAGQKLVFCVCRDLTERKHMEAEKRELEQQAQMASRLATVGEMASGIAHEINNPLTAVIGYADLVLERDIPEEAKDDVRIIHNGAKRVADIIKRLLTFARQYQPERTYLDINDIIKTTLELRAYELETSSIKVTTHLAPDLPRTMADAGQLQQVFLNLIINAETEMKLAHEGGKLLVKTGTVDNTIRISFKDDGPGIMKENLEKIFNPFFTTREVGKGTGLGLSLCHGIIAEHKGQIYAKSKPGKGATFIVELPVITEEKQLEMAEPAEEVKKVAPARILVVDDEPAICQFLKRVLTGEGHEVETVASADDALEKMKDTRYNLILLDIKLPGKSGIELYRHIKDATPTWAKRIVFITGDVIGTDTRSFLSRTKAPYITKPFDTEQLKRDLNRRLAGGAQDFKV